MVSTPRAPKAPNPDKTAAAQSAMNTNTAITQQLLNQTNQVTPDGSLTYAQTGTNSYVGADGKTYSVPQFTATQTLSPEQQALKGINDQTENNIATIGRDQSARVGETLSTPIKLGNEATEARLMELGMKRLDPQFARDDESLRTRLANQGLRPGSAAWNAEMERFGQTKNDAVNQLLLSGRGVANQELLTERNQPINEITALMSGSQVSQPNFTNTPSTGVAGTDYAGMVQNKYAGQMQQYGQQVAQQNAMMGGLFGLASAPFSMFRMSPTSL